jgi:hypothetical protein
MAAAAGKAPLPGDAIPAGRRLSDAVVRWAPSAGRPRGAKNLACDLAIEIRRDQSSAIRDRQAPADRAVIARRRLDRAHIGHRVDFVAADRKRQQHAEQPRIVQPGQQRLRNAPRPLDRVRRLEDRRPQRAHATRRIDQRRAAYHIVHAAPATDLGCYCEQRAPRCQLSVLDFPVLPSRYAPTRAQGGWGDPSPRMWMTSSSLTSHGAWCTLRATRELE